MQLFVNFKQIYKEIYKNSYIWLSKIVVYMYVEILGWECIFE